MGNFAATADIHGHAVNLELTWSEPGKSATRNSPSPYLRLVRRRLGYPENRDDGVAIADLADLFQPDTGEPWVRIERTRFLVGNSLAEGGQLQAEFVRYYTTSDASGSSQPNHVSVGIYDVTARRMVISPISSVKRVACNVETTNSLFGLISRYSIYQSAGEGIEELAGTLVVSTRPVSPGLSAVVQDYTKPDPETNSLPFITSSVSPCDCCVQWGTPVIQTVIDASNTTPIVITTADSRSLSSGASILISGVAGNSAANGVWQVRVDAAEPNRLILAGSAGNGTYLGGGTVAPVVSFVLQEEQTTISAVRTQSPLNVTFDTRVAMDSRDDVSIRNVEYSEVQNADTGEVDCSVAVTDREPSTRGEQTIARGLDGEVTYYYAAWTNPAQVTPILASSTATTDYGFSDKLFAMLPAVHRYYDDPQAGLLPGTDEAGSGQLNRLLQVVGAMFDQARSLGEGLHSLKDLFQARADVLPHWGRHIGWELDRNQPTDRQRSDLLNAPEVFSTVGTLPNIEALVHRSTGWRCTAKEFVKNVFLTNAVEEIRLWEIWQAPAATSPLTLPLDTVALPLQKCQITQAVNDSIDARPAVATDPQLGREPWLFWHSNRADEANSLPSRRQLWMQRLNSSEKPRRVMQGAPDDAVGATYCDEWPAAITVNGAIQLFWSSNRGGSAGIWTRKLSYAASADSSSAPQLTPGVATRLTKHPAGDFCPTVAVDADNLLWLFWHSSRRGPTDIWAMTFSNGNWTRPFRITSGSPRDLMPNAFLDAKKRLCLTWCADLGDRSRILLSTLGSLQQSASSSAELSQSICVSSDPTDHKIGSACRDEAPAAIQLGNVLWVLWSSNHDGTYRLRAAQQAVGSTDWSAPVYVNRYCHAEKDPALFIENGALRLFFRTQQSGEAFRSRTVDMNNLGALRRGASDDRWHYTCAVPNCDPATYYAKTGIYYARDAVGLYITPGDKNDLDDANRVRAMVEPFRPLPVNFVWFIEPRVDLDPFYEVVDIQESYMDNAEFFGPVQETYAVSTPDWHLFHVYKKPDGVRLPVDVTVDPRDDEHLKYSLSARTYHPDYQ